MREHGIKVPHPQARPQPRDTETMREVIEALRSRKDDTGVDDHGFSA
ncbi:hypothetical protein [Novosphingobium kaempferiae]|nr:hypothetical protein [Novosphingobium kaempferiae]